MLRRMLSPMMYGMILIPCFAHIYIMKMPTYGIYILHVLAYFLLVALSRFLKKNSHLITLTMVLILYSAWIGQSYGGLTNLAAVTPIFIYFLLPNTYSRFLILAFHLISINFALLHQDLAWMIVTNLLLLLISYFLHLLQQFSRKQEQELYIFDDIRKKNYELSETRNHLLLFAKQIEGAAQAEERNRISQQLHDDVGHRLIRSKMMMEAALQVFPNDQQKGMTMLQQIRDQLSAGLDEMRATVKRLKPVSNGSGIQSLRQMLEEVGRETGIRTELTIEGNPYSLYPSQEMVLYKNAREAVTNALKHGDPQTVTITFTYTELEIKMAVSNDGNTLDHNISQGTGQGLTGMKERCSFAGGRLEIDTAFPFTVTTVLPVSKHQE
ncbi:Sensor histidine kinase DesK [compost metagenome]